jgi:hypothetical protein
MLDAAGDLAIADADHDFTAVVRFPEGRRRMVVMPGYRERLQVERRVRALRFDAAAERRARFEALA